MLTIRKAASAEKPATLDRLLKCGLLMVSLATAGCMSPPFSEAPIATNYPSQTQKKPQSAAHWLLIANDLVDQIRPTITGNTVSVVSARRAAVETDFSRIFRAQVVSALSGKGIKVNKEASSSAPTVEIDAQLVRFTPNRRQNKDAPVLTLIAAGLWVLGGIEHVGTRNALLAGAAVGDYDWRQWYYSEYPGGATPIGELVVTLSVSNASQILGQRTEVYYIADVDERLYTATPTAPPPEPPPPPRMNIKGGA